MTSGPVPASAQWSAIPLPSATRLCATSIGLTYHAHESSVPRLRHPATPSGGDMQNASIVVAAMLIAACGHQADGPCADVPPAISNVSVSSTGTPTTTSLRWSARQGPNLVTKQFDPQEIQLFLSDVSECGGTVVPTREITMFIYAYALPRGAIPATYPIGQNGPVGPAFGLFFTSGMGEFLNDPTGQV